MVVVGARQTPRPLDPEAALPRAHDASNTSASNSPSAVPARLVSRRHGLVQALDKSSAICRANFC